MRLVGVPGNTVEFKINKRAQIVDYAQSWAAYYQYKQATALSEDEWNVWGTPTPPSKAFNECFPFAVHVYGRCGLSLAGGSGTASFGASTAPDGNPGSLRFFWTKEAVPKPATDPGHVGIIGPNLGYPTRIDNNGLPKNADDFYGPTWRPLDDGVGDAYFNEQQNAILKPVSKTLPATSGVRKPDGELKSLLEELDEE